MTAARARLRWLLLPFVITLVVTLVRLTGELRGWSPAWFGTAAGGGGAIVGIGWLVPVFGWWFGDKLAASGECAPPRATARVLAGWACVIVAFTVTKLLLGVTWPGMATGMLGCVAGAALAWRAWPALARLTLTYAIGARLPIVAITAVAIANDWGTHYEKLADGAPALGPLPRGLVLVLAQAAFWLPITMLGGGLAGVVAARRSARAAQ